MRGVLAGHAANLPQAAGLILRGLVPFALLTVCVYGAAMILLRSGTSRALRWQTALTVGLLVTWVLPWMIWATPMQALLALSPPVSAAYLAGLYAGTSSDALLAGLVLASSTGLIASLVHRSWIREARGQVLTGVLVLSLVASAVAFGSAVSFDHDRGVTRVSGDFGLDVQHAFDGGSEVGPSDPLPVGERAPVTIQFRFSRPTGEPLEIRLSGDGIVLADPIHTIPAGQRVHEVETTMELEPRLNPMDELYTLQADAVAQGSQSTGRTFVSGEVQGFQTGLFSAGLSSVIPLGLVFYRSRVLDRERG